MVLVTDLCAFMQQSAGRAGRAGGAGSLHIPSN